MIWKILATFLSPQECAANPTGIDRNADIIHS